MAQLFLNDRKVCHSLHKRMTSIGPDHSDDITVEADIGFSLIAEAKVHVLQVTRGKLKLNGANVTRRVNLNHCDRIEWAGGSAVFLESGAHLLEESDSGQIVELLKVLQNLAGALQIEGASAMHKALKAIVTLAGAEEAYLLSETKSEDGWELLSSANASLEANPKVLLSNTILRDAIAAREPVCVESIVGHPYAEAASVVAAKVFSVACLPLVINAKVFGAVFLYTKTPGKSIRKEKLPELNLLATQAALLMALQQRSIQKVESSGILCAVNSPMVELELKAQKLAATPLNILVEGETGTGKELYAQYIHRASARAKGPMLALNCSAIPSTLLESTLFGFCKGAFTGANNDQPGKFLLASGGTLFLDEIGDLALELQAKLLRVLQEGVIEPLGSRNPVKVDVRVVAATHKNLEAMVARKEFRADLFYRLAGGRLLLPPLRSRTMDIPILAEYFIAKAGQQKKLSAEAKQSLISYPWPGNIRELEHAVTKAAYLASADSITPQDLELNSTTEFLEDNADFWQSFESLDAAQMAFTRTLVEKALLKFQGNRSLAALRLGISERTLYRVMAAPDKLDSSD